MRDARAYGARNVTHAYTGTTALVNVDFQLERGKIHGLVGENGAGKSTLLKILTGAVSPTEGALYLDDSPVSLHSPADARPLGVAAIHQDVSLFPYMDVATNVYGVGRGLPRTGWFRRLDWDVVSIEVQSLFDRLGVTIPLRASLETLDLGERRMVEIVRCLMDDPRFLVMDEVTAALDPETSQKVLRMLMRLKAEHDIGVCFVSHRLDEVRLIADDVTVLRDGKVAGLLGSHPQEADMIELMLGHAAGELDMSSPHHRGYESQGEDHHAPTVTVKAKAGLGKAAFTLSVKKGEVLGLTGTTGSGALEAVRMLGGAQTFAGEIEIRQQSVKISSPRDAIQHSIGFIPGERQREGIIPEESVATNIFLPSLGAFTSWILLRLRSLHSAAETYRSRLSIRTMSVHSPMKALSGGNQQKVLIGRLLALDAEILVLEEPTHGVDVGAKREIHNLLLEAARNGATVILACTDVNELIAVCDRVAVFRHGEVVGTVSLGDAKKSEGNTDIQTERAKTAINKLMAGVSSDSAEMNEAQI